ELRELGRLGARGGFTQRYGVGNTLEVRGGDVAHFHVDAHVARPDGLQLQRLVGLDHHVHGAAQQLRRGAQALRIDVRLHQVHDDDVVGAQVARHVDGNVPHQAAVVEDVVVHGDGCECTRNRHAGTHRGGEVALVEHHHL